MVTGLGAAVALGVTTKKLLDMLMPTVYADRASLDVQQLHRDIIEVQSLLDECAEDSGDPAAMEHARVRIREIMQRIAPLTNAQRARIASAVDHERTLGQRYLVTLEHDRAALQSDHHVLAEELERLREIDLPAVSNA
jgi:hypothetical protein